MYVAVWKAVPRTALVSGLPTKIGVRYASMLYTGSKPVIFFWPSGVGIPRLYS